MHACRSTLEDPTPWPPAIGEVRVRMAIHAGEAEARDGDYFGQPLNRVARLLSTGYGGQVLLSAAAQALVRDRLPPDAELRDLGEHRLKDLIRPEHVYQLVVPDLPAEFPLLKALDSHQTNLPVQPNPLVGRERELAAAVQRILADDVHLLTLTGPGGTGKSRLALQIAAETLDGFDNGAMFVPLAAIADPAIVTSTIATTLGLREEAGRPLVESLKSYLRDKAMLLVLDNFEQVIGAAGVVAELLANAPRLKLLVTSRTPLHIRAEQEFPVAPLQLPPLKPLPPFDQLAQYAAVALFEQRGRLVRPDFELTRENAAAVAEICHRLDGLPLAIELAAARIRVLPPAAMLARLQGRAGGSSSPLAGGSPPLRLLVGGARDLPARQQTLRDTIAWSYDLLDPAEQGLFARLSIFVGGFTFEAAEAVANADGELDVDVLDGLGSLVDKSLLRQAEGDDEPRFAMLETIREYGLEQLGAGSDEASIRRRHAEHYLALAREASPNLRGQHQQRWLERLVAEHDNLRAALERSLEAGEASLAAELGASIWYFWHLKGWFDLGRSWLQKILDRASDGDPVLLARVLNGAASLALDQGELRQAIERYEAAIDRLRQAGDEGNLPVTQSNLAVTLFKIGEHERAAGLFDEVLNLERRRGNVRGQALALNNRGIIAAEQGDYDRASACYAEVLRLRQELGDSLGVALARQNMALAVQQQGDLPGARELLATSLRQAQELGNTSLVASALNNLSAVVRLEGDPDRARALAAESLALRRDLGDRPGIVASLLNLAGAALDAADHAAAAAHAAEAPALLDPSIDGHTVADFLDVSAEVALSRRRAAQAARLLGAATALRGAGFPSSPTARSARVQALARDALGEADFATAWRAGEAMDPAAAITCALSPFDPA